MKWMRNILKANFSKEPVESKEPANPNVYVPSCGWGTLTDFDAKGNGYIKFRDGSGQIVRNWDHFLDMVQIIETREEDVT